MGRISPQRLAAGLALTGALFAVAARADEPEYRGPAGCVMCHKSGPTRFSPADYVQLTESHTWLLEDKHARSFELLDGDLGKRIGRHMGIADVTREPSCLSCHAYADTRFAKPDDFHRSGVSCESCHGPSSEWESLHRLPAQWRKLAPEQKSAHGMVNVRDPVTRASLCFSCHMGDARQGKVVTHAMYAAGHPPLPGIELATFVEAMPSHWRNLGEKGNFASKRAFIAANSPGLKHDPTGDWPRTQGVVIGGVVALRQSLELFASQFEPQAGRPEFAAFDCQACHHDLRRSGWRQRRDAAGLAPGRPALPAWPAALLGPALHVAAAGDEQELNALTLQFERQLGEVRIAVAAQPFGAAERVKDSTAALIAGLNTLLSDLKRLPVQEDAARRALSALYEQTPDQCPDFHSARQIAWAVLAIESELRAPLPPRSRLERAPADKGILDGQAAIAVWQQWKQTDRDSAAQTMLRKFDEFELSDRLKLVLPAGQQRRIDAFVPESLSAIAAYDPDWFCEQLKALRKAKD